MSQNLYYRTIPRGRDLDDELKFILREHYVLPNTFTESDVAFLKGLVAAKVKGADILVQAIEKNHEVVVYEE